MFHAIAGWDSLRIIRPASLLVLSLAILYYAGLLAVRLRIRLDRTKCCPSNPCMQGPVATNPAPMLRWIEGQGTGGGVLLPLAQCYLQ